MLPFYFILWTADTIILDSAGSRLKTPVLPVWLTYCRGSWGVLFNPNKDLMKSYQAENRYSTHLTNSY